MSRTFTIETMPFDDDMKLFNSSDITIEPGLTVLVGCNGSGKSTLLRFLYNSLSSDVIPVIMYNDTVEGRDAARSKSMFDGNYDTFAALANSSEGECVCINLNNKLYEIGQFVRKHINNGKSEIWILLDAVDSGVSIDNIIDLKDVCYQIILDCKDAPTDVYIVVSANSYELCNLTDCLDVRTGKYITFKSYDDYRNFIRESRYYKEKR